MLKYVDRENNFTEMFDHKTGFYARSGIIENGKDTGIDSFKCNFPQLIDIGIMGHCKHGRSGLCMKSGVQCYQGGAHIEMPNMKASKFRSIIEQCKRKTFQVALGGRGDVDQHEEFEEILATCRENGIVPNFTTSGLEMTAEKAKICKKYTGAVAVSWYRSEHTSRAIDTLITAGVKTNIHYVLGNNSIDEAIKRLKEDNFPKVNAIIFLLHKPVGMGKRDNVLSPTDERVKEFFKMIDGRNYPYKVGFDSCSCAGIVNFMKNIDRQSIDYCEGARYSCYIDAQMNMKRG